MVCNGNIEVSRTVSHNVVFALLVKVMHRFWLGDHPLISNCLKLSILSPNFVYMYFYICMCIQALVYTHRCVCSIYMQTHTSTQYIHIHKHLQREIILVLAKMFKPFYRLEIERNPLL